MRRPTRRTIMLISAGLALVLIALVGGFRWGLPWIVSRELRTVLASAGYPDARFTVKSVSLWQTTLAGGTSGGEAPLLSVDSVRADYSPLDAIRGRIESVRISGASFIVPIDRPLRPTSQPSSAATHGGAFPIRNIRVDDARVTLTRGDEMIAQFPFDASLAPLPGGRSDAKLHAALSSTSSATLSGSVDLDSEALDLRIAARGVEAKSLLGFVPDQVRAWIGSASGTIDLGATIVRSGAGAPVDGTATIELHDAALIGQDAMADREIRGLDVSLTFDKIWPPHASTAQRVRAGSIKLADQSFSNLLLEFTIASAHELNVSTAQLDWASGTVSAEPFVIRPPSAMVESVVSIRRVDLAPILALVSSGRAAGTGPISGRIPVKFDWPKIRFGDGFLAADGTGQLQLGDSVGTFGQLLDASDPRFSQDQQMQQVKQQILDAMKDFQYDRLTGQFVRTGGENGPMRLVVNLAGKGRKPPQQPIDLTLNLSDPEAALNSYLAARSRVLNIGGKE